MLLYFILTGYSLIFSYISYKSNRRIYNPVTVLNSIWSVALLSHLILFGQAIELYLIILGCLTLFNIPYIITEIRVFNNQKFKKNLHPKLNFVNIKKIIYMLSIFELVKVVYIARKVLKIAGSWQVLIYQSTYVRNLYLVRNEALIDKLFGNFLSYSTMFGIILIAIASGKQVKKLRFITLFWLVFEILSALLTMSRMDIIIKILIFTFAYLASIEDPKFQFDKLKKFIPKVTIIVASILILIGIQRNYGGNNRYELILVTFDKLLFYLSSPLEAFKLILDKNEMFLGTHTLLPFYKIVNTFNELPGYLNLTNHAMPVSTIFGVTNVYSMFGLAFLDFWYLGLYGFVFIFGIVSALVFNLTRNYISSRAFDATLLMTLSMSFYGYMYSQTIYILFPFTVLLFDRIFKKFLYKNVHGGSN
jgi:oligosaccharide repeat unit polymerase